LSEDLLRCRVCGREKSVDLATARSAELVHCGTLMRLTESSPRDYAALYARLCDCAGPQPSRENPRADEHSNECPYRKEVEGLANARE
jgi:hypothetical protein